MHRVDENKRKGMKIGRTKDEEKTEGKIQRERYRGWDGWEREEGQMERVPEPTAELSG